MGRTVLLARAFERTLNDLTDSMSYRQFAQDLEKQL